MSDSQDRAEALDDDKMAMTDAPMEELEYPPDEPMGVGGYGTTVAEEQTDEPLEERVAREEPDELPDPEGMRLVEPGTGDEVGAPDDEPDAVGRQVPTNDLSAEEDAVHPTEAPPMGDGDGYVDGS